MIFLPSVSIIINGVVIFLAKIFRREFYIRRNSAKLKLLSYAIIIVIGLLTLNTFFYLIKLSLATDSNISFLAKASKDWQLTKQLEAASLNEEKFAPANGLIINHLPINQTEEVK